MNKKFQDILNFIQQSEKLDAEQKDNLIKTVKDADKELEITAFKLERTEKVKKTTAILLEETIEELEQKRKAVEAQNRELEIEASLERVRAVAMGMNKSDDLLNICKAQFTELKQLGFSDLRNSLISIFNDEKGFFLDYDYSDFAGGSINNIDYNSHPAITNSVNQIRKGNDVLSEFSISGKELDEWNEYRRNKGEHEDPRMENISTLYYYMYSIGSGAIGISNFNPISNEQLQILKRFRNVFDLAYRRYNDITQAEAQVREAQIEAALERVRSLALGMHKSEEVGNVTDRLFEELNKLTLKVIGCTIVVMDEKKDTWETWRARTKAVVKPFEVASFKRSMQVLKKHLPKWFPVFHDALGRREKSLIEEMPKRIRTQLLNSIAEQYNYTEKEKSKLLKITPDKITAHFLFFKLGYLALITEKRLPDENLAVASRFVEVFDFAYTRFLDIKNAEEQARESEIQLALERVRARTMGMQKSEELKEVIQLVYEQFVQLKINLDHSGFVVDYTPKGDWHFWIADQQEIPSKITHPYFDAVWAHQFDEAKEKGIDFFTTKLNFEEKNKFYSELLSYVPGLPEKSKAFYLSCPGLAATTVLFDNVSLYIENFSGIPYSDEENKILLRFGKVFQQTYTRFLDLQKAEVQAREAEIELALERVRARTMAMHSSQDVGDSVITLYDEVKNLNTEATTCGIAIIHDNGQLETWTVTGRMAIKVPGKKRQLHMGFLDISMHPFLTAIVEASKNNQPDFSYNLEGESMKAFFKGINDAVNYSGNFDVADLPPKIFNKFFFFREGALFVESLEELSSVSSQIFTRFAAVFGQTYRRYLDLKKAEVQAREAQIQLALERIRARTMAMQKSDELQEVVHTVLERLKDLDVEFYTAIIILFTEDLKDIMWWLENKEKQQYSRILVPYTDITYLRDLFDARENGRNHFSKTYSFEEKNELFQHLFSATDFKYVPEKQRKFLLESETATMSIAIAKNTGVHLTRYTNKTFSEDDNEILKRIAKVFEQSYVRFLDLQKAEAQAREAQIENALEKVRSRSLAMHKSVELKEVVTVLFERLRELKITMDTANIEIYRDSIKNYEMWVANSNFTYPEPFNYVYFDDLVNNEIIMHREIAQVSGEEIFTRVYPFEIKNEFWKYLFKHTMFGQLPDDRKNLILKANAWSLSCVFSKHSGIVLMNYSDKLHSKDELNVLKRFSRVFEQAYVRFLDLQKAEEQAREAQIEASLERVRAVAMSMHTSDDLLNICEVSFKEFQKLGFDNLRNAIIHVLYDEEKFFIDYDYSEQLGGNITRLEYDSHPIVLEYLNQIKSAEDAFAEVIIKGDELKSWKDFRRNSGQPDDPRLEKISILYYYGYSIGVGGIGVSTFEPIDETQIKILKRFRNVFDLTYRRYNDIALAEKQARETQIQLALERVRARTMAMHKSEELSETSFILFEQLKELGEVAEQMSITIYDEESGIIKLYSTIYGSQWEETGRIPFNKHPVLRNLHKAWKEKKKSIVTDLSGEELDDFNKFKMNYSTQYKSEEDLPKDRWVMHYAFFSKGALTFSTHEPRPLETVRLLERFAGVFDLTYTRFLDLQKAEAQAREAQIEAALERVRARTMAMHTSQELSETVTVLFQQLNLLSVLPERMNIGTINEEKRMWEFWSTEQGGNKIDHLFEGGFDEPTTLSKVYKGLREKKKSLVIDLSGKELNDWIRYLREEIHMPLKEELLQNRRVHTVAFFSKGGLLMTTPEPVPEETINLLERFAKVFEQTYTRFLDLQKAEAQAREAQVEASLERVRAKAMAMHSSKDLTETITVFYRELKSLGVTPRRCGIALMDKETRMAELSTMNTTEEEESIEVIGKIKMSGHPILEDIFEYWLIQKEYHAILRGNQIKDYYQVLKPQISFPDYPHDVVQFGYYFMFKEGDVYAWTEKELIEDELKIFRRFTTVVSLTYKRYYDLQQAEAQAREALKQASLDRVRGEIASMRTSEDLNRITPIIWRELKALEVPFIRCGVFIINEKNEKVHVYLTTPDGKSLGVLNLDFNVNEVTSNTVKYWRNNQVYKEHWNKEEFINWTKSLIEIGQVQNAETYQGSSEPPEILDLHFVPFTQGMLYVGNVTPLTEEKLELVKSLSEAFSIAYARYEDFQRLEAAKAEVESAFGELDILSKELKVKNEVLETENERKALELEEARQLQLSMLPKVLPELPNLDIAVYMKTATEVGGDYYDFQVGTDGTLTAVIGDATGHGMKAGTMVTITKSLFNSLASEEDILDTFSKISRVIKDMKFRRFSMCLLLLKIKDERLYLSSAAMPPVFIYRKKKNEIEEILLKGMPLGSINNFPYTINETKLEKGDTILLLSDGLPELLNENNRMYGYERTKTEFLSVGNKKPDKIVDHLKKSANQWVNGRESDDDVTFVVIKVK